MGPLGLDLDQAWSLIFADFKDVMSIRFKHSIHINILESQAFVLWLKWLLRSRRNHSYRAVILIDSAVVVGAASKGQTSSGLMRSIRCFAALTLARNLQVYIILVPSSHNPSDVASRGIRQALRKCRPAAPTVATSLDGASSDESLYQKSESDGDDDMGTSATC